MEHTYLLRPGRWRAEGTYYDETGRSFPLAGETELVQEGAERHSWTVDGGVRARSGPIHEPLCHPGDGPPLYPDLAVLQPGAGRAGGTFELAGESILSRYVSRDRVYSGCEVLTLQADGSYHNAGVSMKNGRRMSAWTAVLSEERGRT